MTVLLIITILNTGFSKASNQKKGLLKGTVQSNFFQ